MNSTDLETLTLNALLNRDSSQDSSEAVDFEGCADSLMVEFVLSEVK